MDPALSLGDLESHRYSGPGRESIGERHDRVMKPEPQAFTGIAAPASRRT